jgi:hypothetical protein
LPQTPQLLGSSFRFAQLVPHSTDPGKQLQLPEEHAPLNPQEVPQAPQFWGSASMSVHVPLQPVKPGGQGRQLPFAQNSVAAQALPQAPQFLESLSVSTQTPAHDTVGGPQAASHWAALQNAPVGQAFSHAPQWFESLWMSTHFPVQSLNPGLHPMPQSP